MEKWQQNGDMSVVGQKYNVSPGSVHELVSSENQSDGTKNHLFLINVTKSSS